jgi:hypothetical protein
MKEMAFHFSTEGTIGHLYFPNWRPLTIDHIQFHRHPRLQTRPDNLPQPLKLAMIAL